MSTWIEFFERDFQKSEILKINSILEEESHNLDDKLILPPISKRFAAFDKCKLKDVKVCIYGQDPYHTRGVANGLCFSVERDIKIPPSLKNIFKELDDDLGIKKESGDLSSWAEQGVLMLNSALSVRESCANSHAKLWKKLTDSIIQHISNECEGVVFILWGNFAKEKQKFIDQDKHYILTSTHPSPMSANRGGFFGCKHFSKCNKILLENNKVLIDW